MDILEEVRNHNYDFMKDNEEYKNDKATSLFLMLGREEFENLVIKIAKEGKVLEQNENKIVATVRNLTFTLENAGGYVYIELNDK